MQIIFFPKAQTIILCFILWPLFQLTAIFICNLINKKFYSLDKTIFKTFRWEQNGKIYKKIFYVHLWKKYLPDGGAVVKSGFKKKKLMNISDEYLNKFLQESCRAELSHWLAIFPFWIFGLFIQGNLIIYMFAYALLVNIPCIIAQRYNRPRFIKLLGKIDHA